MVTGSLNRLKVSDPRFKRAARIFRSEREEDLAEAKALLAELLREGWHDYERRAVVSLREEITADRLRDLLAANRGNATDAARELGVHPKRIQRLRAALLDEEDAA